jgi:hypothetical protein
MMSLSAMAQNVMSPETLWKLGRVSALFLRTLKRSLQSYYSFY